MNSDGITWKLMTTVIKYEVMRIHRHLLFLDSHRKSGGFFCAPKRPTLKKDRHEHRKKLGEKHGVPTVIIPQLRERKNEKMQKKYRKGIDYLEMIGYNHSNKTEKAQKENRKGKQQ